jgi:energy-converting hydrogenase A subunit M
MSTTIYEKDLTAMKYAILVSSRHDRVVREIAADLQVGVQQLRRYIIEHFDMMLMENIPARYEAGKKDDSVEEPIARELGMELYTRYVPLFAKKQIGPVIDEVEMLVAEGKPEKEAIRVGKAILGEVLIR